MFCPKCGTQALEGTKFCRLCGADLETVSAALTGKLTAINQKNKKKKDHEDEDSNDPDKLLSCTIRNGLGGLAFIFIALFLTFTGTIGGNVWGFWLLIPGAYTLGSGISCYLKAKKIERRNAEIAAALRQQAAFAAQNPGHAAAPLPSRQTLFVNDYEPPPGANTGELVAPPTSVTEGTTRLLETNTEDETVHLQPQK
jgi:hypothetical protein